MSFCKEVREEFKDVWESSFHHPFVTGLADGTLPEDVFRYYVMQDSYYLTHFAKVQALGAVKATDLEMTRSFAHHAEQTCVAELSLHESFMQILGVTEAEWEAFEPSPSAYAYVSHMYRAAQGDVADVLAALLPCYWLYYEIGVHLQEATPENPIYQRWISTYGSEWFKTLVEEQKDRMDNLAMDVSSARLKELKTHFKRSAYYEWHFWEQAWTQEKWTVNREVPTYER